MLFRSEAPRVGHEDAEGDLPHHGGLAGHVRTAHDEELILLPIESTVVGNDALAEAHPLEDRKSVVSGKSVDLGGRRIIKKQTIPLSN